MWSLCCTHILAGNKYLWFVHNLGPYCLDLVKYPGHFSLTIWLKRLIISTVENFSQFELYCTRLIVLIFECLHRRKKMHTCLSKSWKFWNVRPSTTPTASPPCAKWLWWGRWPFNFYAFWIALILYVLNFIPSNSPAAAALALQSSEWCLLSL